MYTIFYFLVIHMWIEAGRIGSTLSHGANGLVLRFFKGGKRVLHHWIDSKISWIGSKWRDWIPLPL